MERWDIRKHIKDLCCGFMRGKLGCILMVCRWLVDKYNTRTKQTGVWMETGGIIDLDKFQVLIENNAP